MYNEHNCLTIFILTFLHYFSHVIILTDTITFKRTRAFSHINLSETQHGFRAGHSTIKALLPLVHQVATGLNQNYSIHRTVSMAVDFPKACELQHCEPHNSPLRHKQHKHGAQHCQMCCMKFQIYVYY